MEKHLHPQRKLEKQRGLFFRIGLAVSLLITFLAFEWETQTTRYQFPDEPADSVETVMIPITWPEPVKTEIKPELDRKINKSKSATQEIEIIPDDQIIAQITDSALIADIVPVDTKPEIEIPEPEIFFSPEEMPEFPGGLKGLNDYLVSETHYPDKAIKAGINGTVYVKFIIDKTGKAVNYEILRSPSEIFNAEAIRVLDKMPRWKPGKQNGIPVPVVMTLPFTFHLK